MDNKFGENKKVGKGKERREKERKQNVKKTALICIGGNGRERKGNGIYPFKSFQLWNNWNINKKYPSDPFNSLPSKFLPSHFAIQIRNSSFHQIPPFSFPSFPSIQTRPNVKKILYFNWMFCLLGFILGFQLLSYGHWNVGYSITIYYSTTSSSID